jgi:uncharacterized protein YuzE
MRLHRISEREVETVIAQPAYFEPSGEDRINAWAGGETEGFLRVTYKEEQAMLLVISAVRKKKGWRWSLLRIEYDREADALYIQLRQARVDDNIDIEEGVTVDLDEQRHVIGLEILDASKRLSIEDIVNITIENIPVDKVETGTA